MFNYSVENGIVIFNYIFVDNGFCILILFDFEFDKIVEWYVINLVIGVLNVVLLLFGVVVNFFIVLVIFRKVLF